MVGRGVKTGFCREGAGTIASRRSPGLCSGPQEANRTMVETGETMPDARGDRLRCDECQAEMIVKPGNTVPACERCGGTEFSWPETAPKR